MPDEVNDGHDDPGYHADNAPDSHDTTCSSPGGRCDSGGDTWVPEGSAT